MYPFIVKNAFTQIANGAHAAGTALMLELISPNGIDEMIEYIELAQRRLRTHLSGSFMAAQLENDSCIDKYFVTVTEASGDL